MGSEYQQWQDVLSRALLPPRAGPTVLFVDDDELARFSSGETRAAEDLASAVGTRLNLTDGRSMFAPIMALYRTWQRGPQLEAPPTMPLLALTVLAATRMRSDSEARSTNYYLRLAQALMPSAEVNVIEALRNQLREGSAFLDVVDLWRGLHTWIETQNGAIGVSTIRDHPHLQRIGYPLSQALVRQSDRATLSRFFQALDFPPGAAPDVSVILGALDIWTAAAQNRFSEAFMRALADSDLRPLLGAVIDAHARVWDGRVLTSDGKQRIGIKLGIDLDNWDARWLFPVPPGGPETLTLSTSIGGKAVALEASFGFDYYYSTNSTVPVLHDPLLLGIRMKGGTFTAEFPPSPVIFLRLDPQTGGWSSTSGMLPFEEHLVAISAPHAMEFRQVLIEAAVEGWRLVPQRASILLPGYSLFQSVRFADGQALALVLSRLPGLRRIGVSPAVIPRARLVRGLPLATSISATHYLVGGEPDLLLPSGAEPHLATVTLDGKSERLQANGFPLELRRFLDAAGPHFVDADGQQIAFTTLQGGPDPAPPSGTGSLGWNAEAQMSNLANEHLVSGAQLVEVAGTQLVLARRGRDETWLLHDNGSSESVTEPAPPPFLSTIDIQIHSARFEIDAPTSARWLAQRRGIRWRLAEIGTSSPKQYELDIDVLGSWKLACNDAKGEQLWHFQLSIAGAL